MDMEELEEFFKKHPTLKEEKSGLYLFLLEADWRERYKVSMDEAEHLAGIRFSGPATAESYIWARELERYRGQRK